MKKVLTFIFFLFLSVQVFGQDRYVKSSNLEAGPIQSYPGSIVYYDDRGTTYPNEIPGTASFFDYETNGANLTSLWAKGDTIIACYFGCDSLDPTGVTSRVGYYVVSFDAGSTWGTPVALTTLPRRSSYIEIYPYIQAGTRNVGLSGRLYTSPGPGSSAGGAWSEAFLGLGSLQLANVPIGGLDYFGAYLSGTTLGGLSSVTGDSLFFIKYDLNTNVFNVSSRRLIATPTTEIATNHRYQFAADGTGNNMLAMWWFSTGGSEAIRMKTSTDGGNTWGSMQTLQQSLGVNGVIGGDTVGPYLSMDAIYKPGTSTPYAAWTDLYPTGTGLSSGDNQGCKIVVWSPALNGGVPVEAAGRHNMTIISDTSLFNLQDSSQIGVTPVSHPSLGFSDDGNTIYCAFSGFQPTNVYQNYNYNDIYVTYSNNGGATWSTPQNITNTPDWDELYPVISETGNSASSYNIKFMATRIPGAQSFTNNRPVSKVFHVFNRRTTGIANISNEVPEGFSLKQNYPNPFNPTTSIRFDISKATNVTLKVFDMTGKEVAILANNEKVTPGTKEITFSGSNLSSGIYFYTLSTSEGLRETKKMMLLK